MVNSKVLLALSSCLLLMCKTRTIESPDSKVREGTIAPLAGRSSTAIESLLAGVDPKTFSIDELYKRFVGDDPKAKERVLLVYKSRSPLLATPASPRIIAYSQTAGLVISSAGSIVEIMEFDNTA